MPEILKLKEERGEPVFTRDNSVNIVVVRRLPEQVDKFEDDIHLCWRDKGRWQHRRYPCTTNPGLAYLLQPMNLKGTAVLKPGLWKFKIGLHQGKYKALRQSRPVEVWRDANKDGHIDRDGATDIGMFGINIHRAGSNSTQVGRWSAGCIVLPIATDFAELLSIVERSIKITGVSEVSVSLFEVS